MKKKLQTYKTGPDVTSQTILDNLPAKQKTSPSGRRSNTYRGGTQAQILNSSQWTIFDLAEFLHAHLVVAKSHAEAYANQTTPKLMLLSDWNPIVENLKDAFEMSWELREKLHGQKSSL